LPNRIALSSLTFRSFVSFKGVVWWQGVFQVSARAQIAVVDRL
jgi:hypothetical protein